MVSAVFDSVFVCSSVPLLTVVVMDMECNSINAFSWSLTELDVSVAYSVSRRSAESSLQHVTAAASQL